MAAANPILCVCRPLLVPVFLMMLCTTGHHTKGFSSREVFISEELCDQVVDLGTNEGSWKRVLFRQNHTCEDSFDCKVTVRTGNITPSEETVACVDFSRLRIHDDSAFLHVGDRYRVYHQLTYHHKGGAGNTTVFCSTNEVVLHFKGQCGTGNRPLGQSFRHWLYLYRQQPSTGSIYFVDGSCNHLHRIGEEEESRVTLLSYLWPREADTDTDTDAVLYERCSLRLLLQQRSNDSASGAANVSVLWVSSGHSVVPPGVTVSIFEADVAESSRTKDQAASATATTAAAIHHLTLETGDGIGGELNASYTVASDKELVFEVVRRLPAGTRTTIPQQPPPLHLLFELCIIREDASYYSTDEEATSEGSTVVTTRILGYCLSLAQIIVGVHVMYTHRRFFTCARARNPQQRDQAGANGDAAAAAAAAAENDGMLSFPPVPPASSSFGFVGQEGAAREDVFVPFPEEDLEAPPPSYYNVFPYRYYYV